MAQSLPLECCESANSTLKVPACPASFHFQVQKRQGSGAHFKTLKYRPDFPERFGSLEHARLYGVDFFRWYNTEHRHSGLGLHTPHDVHFGLAEPRRAQRAAVLSAAYAARPDRFVRHPPTPATLPTAAWINPPKLLVASEDVRRPHVQ